MSSRGTTRGRGRGRGRGRAAPTSDNDQPKCKRAKNAQKASDCIFLLIDTGISTLTPLANGKTAFEMGQQIADWILSRKIFADSDVAVNVAFFPPLSTVETNEHVHQNIQFLEDKFVTPRLEHVKRILEAVPSAANESVLAALLNVIEIESDKVTKGEQSYDSISFAIISNFLETHIKDDMDTINEIVKHSNNLGACINFIGYDNGVPVKKDDSHPVATLLECLNDSKNAQAVAIPFDQAFTSLSYFGQRQKQIRGAPFTFELGENLSIAVTMFSKITRERFALKSEKVTDDNQIVKIIREFQKSEETLKSEVDLDAPAAEENSNRFKNQSTNADTGGVNKDEVIRGYHYGSSIIPFSKADKEFKAVKPEGKQLQLVQFTKKHNILPYFYLTESRWLIPNISNQDKSDQYLHALVKSMIDRDVVAIVRYAYSIVAQPRLAVLVPEFLKDSQCPVLQLYQLPFNEDFRLYEFPELKDVGEEPDDMQLDAMDAYIDHFMLDLPKGDSLYDAKKVRNPIQQKTCMTIKRKALGMPPALSEDEVSAILAPLSTPTHITEDAETVLNTLTEFFNLTKVEDQVGYSGHTLADIKGIKKIDDWSDMQI